MKTMALITTTLGFMSSVALSEQTPLTKNQQEVFNTFLNDIHTTGDYKIGCPSSLDFELLKLFKENKGKLTHGGIYETYTFEIKNFEEFSKALHTKLPYSKAKSKGASLTQGEGILKEEKNTFRCEYYIDKTFGQIVPFNLEVSIKK